MIIFGDAYAGANFLSATKFTTKEDGPQFRIDNNVYFPRICIATASWIGNDLYPGSIFKVVHIFSSSSVIDTVQDMGGCDRNRINEWNSTNTPELYTCLVHFQIFILMNDFTKILIRTHPHHLLALLSIKRIDNFNPKTTSYHQNLILVKECVNCQFECKCSNPLNIN